MKIVIKVQSYELAPEKNYDQLINNLELVTNGDINRFLELAEQIIKLVPVKIPEDKKPEA